MKRLALFLFFVVPVAAQVSLPNPQSRVAGRFVAFNYGGWRIPVYSAPVGTGSHTFSVPYSSVQLVDGRMVMPFNTNSPIYVGTEEVTPSAVGPGCTLGNTVPGACVLTATFSNPHTNSDFISSATFGLQEALNDAGASGGGAVTVDSAWSGAGGTTGIINAATLPTHTSIEDVRTGIPASGGVTKIVAGTNVTISPSGGTGDVTVNAAGVGGTGTTGFLPIFTDTDVVADSHIDEGVTQAATITINASGVAGAPAYALIIGGVNGIGLDAIGGDQIADSVDAPIAILAGHGIEIQNVPSSGPYNSPLLLSNNDTGGIQILDTGGGGITVTGIVSPGLRYSAAGTPLPAANSVPAGAEATVSDATLPTYMGAYVSGGAVVCKVISDGATGWFTH